MFSFFPSELTFSVHLLLKVFSIFSSNRHEHLRYSVTIVLVGKYTQLEDSYASVIKALQHAALACNRKLELKCMEAEDLEEEAKANRPVKYYEAWQNVCKAK